MAKKVFTDESLETLVDEIKSYSDTNLATAKSYTDTVVNNKANSSHTHSISNITNLQSSLDAKVPTSRTVNGKSLTGNITLSASDVGAANSSHTHTVANISDLTATATELNYVDGVTSNIQTQLNSKAGTSHTHNTLSVQSDNYKQGNDLPSTYPRGETIFFSNNPTNKFNNMAYCTVHTIKGYNNMVCIQWLYPYNTNADTVYYRTALYNTDVWRDWQTVSVSEHTHNYAGSSSAGGSATSAVKLDTNTAGDTNTPVYFTGGKPVACTSLDLNTTGSSASCTGNSATATKLQTARTISLGTGATGTATSFNGTSDITIPVTNIKESYLSWGGKNLVGSVSPIGASLSTEHSANRLAYLNPNAVTVEYSNDAGSTWVDSGIGNSGKINFVTTSNTISVGSNSTVTTNHRTRITLTAQDGTNSYVYTRPRKMLINVSTPHGLTVTIEAKNGTSDATWTTLGTYELTGWSGWNDIPMGISTFGGGKTQTSNYWYLRLTFANTSVNSSYTTTKSSIIGLRLFGDTCWTRTSNMGETGHLYSYDSSQNATFPANVTATTFVGALSGNATTSTTATNVAWSGVTSKPSYYDAKAIKSITRSGTTFTYTCMDGTTGTFTQQDNNTTYSVATTSANGLMSSSDKTKIDSIELATLAEVKTYLGI